MRRNNARTCLRLSERASAREIRVAPCRPYRPPAGVCGAFKKFDHMKKEPTPKALKHCASLPARPKWPIIIQVRNTRPSVAHHLRYRARAPRPRRGKCYPRSSTHILRLPFPHTLCATESPVGWNVGHRPHGHLSHDAPGAFNAIVVAVELIASHCSPSIRAATTHRFARHRTHTQCTCLV